MRVGWLSDPINSQGVNKQLTAAAAAMGEGEENRFSDPFVRCRREGRKEGRIAALGRARAQRGGAR